MTGQMAGALRWSTQAVAKADRFAYWREALSSNLIGMTPEASAEDRDQFEGEVTCIPVGQTGVMQLDMKISRLRMDRAASDIRALPGDGLFLFRASGSEMNFLFHDRQNFAPQPGVTVMGGLDRERYSQITQPGRYRCEVLRIPSAALAGVVRDASQLDPREVDFATGPSSLLHGFFNSFLRELPRLTMAERETSLATLTSLVALSLRRDLGREEPVQDAVRTAKLRAAQDYILRHAADGGLTPASAAQALRISIRQLHALFEPVGISFSRFLTAERVRLALHLLKADPALTVSDVAFRCGFESLPTFYRAFRAATGAAPGDMRQKH